MRGPSARQANLARVEHLVGHRTFNVGIFDEVAAIKDADDAAAIAVVERPAPEVGNREGCVGLEILRYHFRAITRRRLVGGIPREQALAIHDVGLDP